MEILVASIRAVLSRGPFRPYSSRLGYYVPNALRGSPTFALSLFLSLSLALASFLRKSNIFNGVFTLLLLLFLLEVRCFDIGFRLRHFVSHLFESFDKPSLIRARLLLDFKRDELDRKNAGWMLMIYYKRDYWKRNELNICKYFLLELEITIARSTKFFRIRFSYI